MIRKLAPLAMFFALAACPGPVGPPASPGDRPPIAQRTTADEQARLRCEQGYALSRTLGEVAVDAGVVHGPLAVRLADLDNKLFAGLGICRTAYAAFNSSGLLVAADNVASLADQVQTLVKGGKK